MLIPQAASLGAKRIADLRFAAARAAGAAAQPAVRAPAAAAALPAAATAGGLGVWQRTGLPAVRRR